MNQNDKLNSVIISQNSSIDINNKVNQTMHLFTVLSSVNKVLYFFEPNFSKLAAFMSWSE